MEHAFTTLVVLNIPQMFTWVNFEDVENDRAFDLRLGRGISSNFQPR